MSSSAKLTGNRGEDAACRYLSDRGYEILARNYTVRYGELDIVAKKDGLVSFVEVKARKNTAFGSAAEAVSLSKQRKLAAAAGMWLAESGWDGPTRFDVAEVYPGGTLHYIEDAFRIL